LLLGLGGAAGHLSLTSARALLDAALPAGAPVDGGVAAVGARAGDAMPVRTAGRVPWRAAWPGRDGPAVTDPPAAWPHRLGGRACRHRGACGAAHERIAHREASLRDADGPPRAVAVP
jgi:hypothetical protein